MVCFLLAEPKVNRLKNMHKYKPWSFCFEVICCGARTCAARCVAGGSTSPAGSNLRAVSEVFTRQRPTNYRLLLPAVKARFTSQAGRKMNGSVSSALLISHLCSNGRTFPFVSKERQTFLSVIVFKRVSD